MEVKLRSQCQDLLNQLRSSQTALKNNLVPSSIVDAETHHHDGNTTLTTQGNSENLHPQETISSGNSLKPAYARNKLGGLSRTSKLSSDNRGAFCHSTDLARSMNSHDYNQRQHFSPTLASGNGVSLHRNTNTALENSHLGQAKGRVTFDGVEENADTNRSPVAHRPWSESTASSWYPATPNTIQKRQLINRHTSVPSKLTQAELKELDDERLLNFNYCHISVNDDVTKLKTGPLEEDVKEALEKDIVDNRLADDGGDNSYFPQRVSEDALSSLDGTNFREQLRDEGNDRKFGHWLKETTIKPKTLLNSTDYYSLQPNKKNSSRVRFDSSTTLDAPVLDQHLLGYDWIAALLDNDPNLVNQSESFFDEIKDFRKAFKDECSNRFYMESPYTLVDTEPLAVADALTEPKVRPYIVNDRLFTEPLKPGIIDYDDDNASGKSKNGAREPTEKNPRFVRVSIPRSSLQTPYRVRPHRRGSFDGSDSCALMDHCLLGWENSRHATIPSAKTLDLNTEAGTRIDSETTTLAEAEKLASEHNRVQWPFSQPSARVQTLPTWRKHYMNTTLNMTLPPSRSNNASANGTLQGSRDIKRATDRILRDTYSTMYEMERLRQERELERKRDMGDRV